MGFIGIMETKMETTIVYWGDIGIMERKMEGFIDVDFGFTVLGSGFGPQFWALEFGFFFGQWYLLEDPIIVLLAPMTSVLGLIAWDYILASYLSKVRNGCCLCCDSRSHQSNFLAPMPYTSAQIHGQYPSTLNPDPYRIQYCHKRCCVTLVY